jgi:hypothetical protein
MNVVDTDPAGRMDGCVVWRKMERVWRNVMMEPRCAAVETHNLGGEPRARPERVERDWRTWEGNAT